MHTNLKITLITQTGTKSLPFWAIGFIYHLHCQIKVKCGFLSKKHFTLTVLLSSLEYNWELVN